MCRAQAGGLAQALATANLERRHEAVEQSRILGKGQVEADTVAVDHCSELDIAGKAHSGAGDS